MNGAAPNTKYCSRYYNTKVEKLIEKLSFFKGMQVYSQIYNYIGNVLLICSTSKWIKYVI